MEYESSINERCLNMFLDALKFARENNIKEADEVLHDIEARHMVPYMFTKHAIEEMLGKHSNFSKSCVELTNDYDNITHPYHYTQGGIECIDGIKASMTDEEFEGFLKGNAIKYIWRYKNKNNPVEDLKKAKWYLEKLINTIE